MELLCAIVCAVRMAAVHVFFSLSKMGKGEGVDGVKGEAGRGKTRERRKYSHKWGNCSWTVVAKRLISHAWRIQTIL